MHEFEIIKKYFSLLSVKNKASLNLNDDVFFNKSSGLVISVDTYIEGVHFINFTNPGLVIKKILRSSISDLISKGVKPKYYFLSASGNKKNFSKKKLSQITKSLNEEQKKYKIMLGGGDTVSSSKLSFTIVSVGFSNKIIKRNKSKVNDDIYVTGNLGDSFIGLKILKKKININKKYSKFFINKYFKPDIKISIAKYLNMFASSSIDISDGLISDLEKMTNIQNNSYIIYLDKIPLSKELNFLTKLKKFKKKNLISNGDDYQVLFTSSRKNRNLIRRFSHSQNIKITRIGKILDDRKKSSIIDRNGNKIKINNNGYVHRFG